MTIFDSDNLNFMPESKLSSLDFDKFDRYTGMAYSFIGSFFKYYGMITMDLNRIEKRFHLTVDDNGLSEVVTASYINKNRKYPNGNVKWMENFFYLLNDEFGLSSRDLRIPNYPTSSADGYFEWYILKSYLDTYFHRFLDSSPRDVHPIMEMTKKYFKGWVVNR